MMHSHYGRCSGRASKKARTLSWRRIETIHQRGIEYEIMFFKQQRIKGSEVKNRGQHEHLLIGIKHLVCVAIFDNETNWGMSW